MITTFRLKKEISTSEEMISSLESQQKDLKKRKENLEDPEYVKRYARGKFMVSKPGEQIFKLPSKSDDPANDGNLFPRREFYGVFLYGGYDEKVESNFI